MQTITCLAMKFFQLLEIWQSGFAQNENVTFLIHANKHQESIPQIKGVQQLPLLLQAPTDFQPLKFCTMIN